MKLIDKDVALKEVQRLVKLTDEQKELKERFYKIIKTIPEIDAIPIEWLQKRFVDAMYDGDLASDQMEMYHKILARWKDENSDNVHKK